MHICITRPRWVNSLTLIGQLKDMYVSLLNKCNPILTLIHSTKYKKVTFLFHVFPWYFFWFPLYNCLFSGSCWLIYGSPLKQCCQSELVGTLISVGWWDVQCGRSIPFICLCSAWTQTRWIESGACWNIKTIFISIEYKDHLSRYRYPHLNEKNTPALSLWWKPQNCYSVSHDGNSTAELFLNSSSASAAYMRQWIGSALVKIMACRLFVAKPLSKPMLGYC